MLIQITIFMKYARDNLLPLFQMIKKPDFPSLADEIAEPGPDINIKFAAFTVTQKLYYARKLVLFSSNMPYDLNHLRIIQ